MKVTFIFESLGSPKDFVIKFLSNLLEEIKKFEKGKVMNHSIEEPIEREVPSPDGKTVKMWSSFLEVEMDFRTFEDLLDFVLMYNPSSIEIQDDIKKSFDKEELNNILNTISARLIQLSLLINNLRAQNAILLKNLEKVAPRLAQQFKPKSNVPKDFKVKL